MNGEFWLGILGAVIAWAACDALGAVVAWFWKIRPHVLAQKAERVAQDQHRADVAVWINGLHDRHDDLEARLNALGAPTAPQQTGAHGHTDTFVAVPDGR